MRNVISFKTRKPMVEAYDTMTILTNALQTELGGQKVQLVEDLANQFGTHVTITRVHIDPETNRPLILTLEWGPELGFPLSSFLLGPYNRVIKE